MALTRPNGWLWRGPTVLLTLPLWFGVMSPATAGTVHCMTCKDPKFTRLVTTSTDGSRAVTRNDEPFKRWGTDIVKLRKASEAIGKKAPHRSARPGRLRG